MIGQIDREYLRYGFGRAMRRIASYGLYEGRPLTTKGRFINPMVFGWLNAQAIAPGSPTVVRPTFITGLGRSGTTILGILLSLNRAVGYLNEPKAMWHVIDPRQDINGNYSTDGAQFRLAADLVTDPVRRRAHRIFSRYLNVTGATRVVDKYPELIFRVGYVRAIFPDARFVFITRSGTDAIPSVVQWSERLGVKTRDHVDDWWGRDDIKWRYMREQLILGSKEYRPVWNIATADLDHLHRAALEWIITMREGLAQQRLHPDAILRISYEDLLADPAGVLATVQNWCDVPADSAVIDYARKRLYDNPSKRWPKLKTPVDALLRETMAELGYAAP